jgi:hypothetical protein
MTNYDQDTWQWKLQKLIQQFQEWWELKVRNFFKHSPNLPQIDSPNLSGLNIIVQVILFIIAFALIFWGILRIINLVKTYYLSKPKSSPIQLTNETELATQEWLKKSKQFQQQEDYYQACRCLYFAMLQHLNDQNVLNLEKSRTDQEYSYLLFVNLPYPSPYETLLNIHQKLCFSTQKATLNDFNQCQQAYQEIMNYEF